MTRLRGVLIIGLFAALAPAAAQAAFPSLYFHYAPDCTFTAVDDGGAALTTLAPGTYQVVVDTPFPYSTNPAACKFVQFDLSGPGVDYTTTLGDGGSTIDSTTVTLKPSSSYVAQDDGAAARTRKAFATAASGTPIQVAAAGSGTTTTSTTPSSAGSSAVGTSLPKAALRGTLTATVGASGKLTLTRKGRPVQILPAGRYDFSVVDRSHSAGFTVQAVRSPPITLTAGSFVGRKSRSITLNRGQWLFYGSFVGKKTYFIVTAT